MGGNIVFSPSIANIGGTGTWLSNVGLLWSDGVEPASSAASLWPFQSGGGRRIWYVDANAVSNGSGTSGSPYWSLTEVNANLIAGDHVYVTGDFTAAKHSAGVRDMTFTITSSSKLGPRTNPTVIRSWPDHSRAKFDGNYSQDLGITVQPASAVLDTGMVVINVEVTRRSDNPGINLYKGGDGDIGLVRVISCWSHHNASTSGSGNSSYGGIAVKATDQACDIKIYNCVCHNSTTTDGSTPGGSDNTGGINVLSETSGAGSVVECYYNLVHDEIYGMRHKHAGAIDFRAYWNHLYTFSGTCAFQIRGLTNSIHTNLVESCAALVGLEPQNQVGARTCTVNNNTLYLVNELVTPFSNPFVANDITDVHSNIYYNPSRTQVMSTFGTYSSSAYYVAGLSIANNVIYHGSTTNFYAENGTTKTRTQFDTEFGAGVNVYTDPLFTDAAGGNFTLQAGSPALSVNGVRAGAF